MNPQYKTCTLNAKISTSQSREQHGVVLFIALIALVVLSLAAVALIRSVDTSSIIAGNLAFKQSATISADSGLESAITWISLNPTTLDNNKPALGYYAVGLPTPPTLPLLQTDPTQTGWAGATWNDTNSAKAIGTGIVAGTETVSGNTIRYIIQRMCSVALPPTSDKCLFGAPVAGSNDLSVKPAPLVGTPPPGTLSPMYRITVRVAGPQNTVSYTQAYVY